MSKLYKKSGVDVIKTDNLISQALKFIKSTHNPNVLGNKLGFSAEYKVNKDVTLCSATDGVGTKAILAAELKYLLCEYTRHIVCIIGGNRGRTSVKSVPSSV